MHASMPPDAARNNVPRVDSLTPLQHASELLREVMGTVLVIVETQLMHRPAYYLTQCKICHPLLLLLDAQISTVAATCSAAPQALLNRTLNTMQYYAHSDLVISISPSSTKLIRLISESEETGACLGVSL